jgi:UDP-N-acetylmuramyl pentapeptide phosphotransferase/UDP-N-acetylglucosamine-1-phosphate transferase
MVAGFEPHLPYLLVATAALAALFTAVAIRYARRRRLFDLPGQRRSHDAPTPRGGGIAIVVALLAGACVLAVGHGELRTLLPWLAPPIVLVALAGWLDDHGGSSAGLRFAVHCVAAAWICARPFAGAAATSLPQSALLLPAELVPYIALAVAAFVIIWSINLHNFMDGINGLLAWQALFVFVALALLAAWRGEGGGDYDLVCAFACVGFLPFNFPRARIFMGDVGSGVLGLMLALAVLQQAPSPRIAMFSGLVLCSTFVTDATCTLLSRMFSGRRWYSAHREHLYQWLVRSGFSHARVVALYMGWNLLVTLPVVGWMNRVPYHPMPTGLVPAVAAYALAATAWWSGKRWCMRRARERSSHAAA